MKVGTSAADLKFLHRLRQTHSRNFKSKSGTRIIYLLVPLLLPKFVCEGAAMYHELRKRGTCHVLAHRTAHLIKRRGISASTVVATPIQVPISFLARMSRIS